MDKLPNAEQHYERPSQTWLCGRAARPCREGPDGDGQCRGKNQCLPRRQNARWYCTRNPPCKSGPFPDGSCARSTPPCTPVRSIAARRTRFGLYAGFFSLGLLFLLLTLPAGDGIISPGPLSAGHAALHTNCGVCHEAGARHFIGRLESALQPPSALEEGQRCLRCHRLGEAPFSPHALHQSSLIALSGASKNINENNGREEYSSLLYTAMDSLFGTKPRKEIPCNNCHREHQGGRLADVHENSCKSCHSHRFESFANGHPDFFQYPYKRRSRIIFDHKAHFTEHFEAAESLAAPRRCTACHYPEQDSGHMLVRAFADTCADCHGIHETDASKQPDGRAVAVFNIPVLDTVTLNMRGIYIGEWPEDIKENRLTPLTGLLLSADPKLDEAEIRRFKKLNLGDLRGAAQSDLESVGRVAWALKKLVLDMEQGGHGFFQERLRQALLMSLPENSVRDLSGQIPAALFSAARQAWFPNAVEELAAYQSGQTTPASVSSSGDVLPPLDEEQLKFGGWYRDGGTLYYRPVGHADIFLRAWLELSALNTPSTQLRLLFETLAAPGAPGLCIKCHSVEEDQGSSFKVNWTGYRSDYKYRGSVHFSHAPHFNLPETKGCVTCHELDLEAEYQKAFDERDSNSFSSAFKDMHQKQCSACHQSGKAGDTCLDCHHYHVGRVLSNMPESAISAQKSLPLTESVKPRP